MKMKRFENKIRKDMMKASSITIILMALLSVILLGVYSFNMRSYRLQQTLNTYTTIVPETISKYEEDLFKLNEKPFSHFIDGSESVSDSQIYSLFYSFNAEQTVKSDLLVLDTQYQTLLSSNTSFEDNYAFLNYISIVIQNEIASDFQHSVRVFKSNNSEIYLVYVYPFYRENQLSGYGITLTNGRELQLINQAPDTNYAIYDNYNNVLATNNNQVTLATGKLNQDFLVDETSKSSYHSKSDVINDNLSVISFTSNEAQMTVLISSIIVLFILSLLVILQSLYFSKIISHRTGRSLYFLNSEMDKVKTYSDYRISIETNDEFEVLADDINVMVDDLRLTHDNYISLSKLNLRTEKRKLEAQFHPHFLANTLETIRSAMYIDTDLANELLLRMNGLLRYSIDEGTTDTQLCEDIEYLKNYLSINKIRFEDFDYRLNHDRSLDQLSVPKLFLLPLIENSLKYGYKNRRDLKVLISISKKEESVIFRVMDNGNALNSVGIEKVEKLLSTESETVTYHHGLKNTYQRISLLYPQSEFKLFSKLGCTVNEITIKGVANV